MADLKELEFARLRGKLISVDVFRKHVAANSMVVRQNFLSLAVRIAPQLEGQTRSWIREALHKKVCEILANLATGKDFNKVLKRTYSGSGDSGLREKEA
jgi:hypothetical protein